MSPVKKSTQRFSTQTYRKVALFGYISLLIFMPLWLIVLNPSTSLPLWLNSLLFIAPLLLPIRGLFTGNPYTYAWANFILMWYFLHSLTTLWVNDDDVIWASIELLLTSIMFIGATYYAKYRGQELGLSLRKNKQEQ